VSKRRSPAIEIDTIKPEIKTSVGGPIRIINDITRIGSDRFDKTKGRAITDSRAETKVRVRKTETFVQAIMSSDIERR
jgi:hypothetical protein